eukprot:SAG31_NODE_1219_length_9302_cov_13.527328_6_plen_347_part_00
MQLAIEEERRQKLAGGLVSAAEEERLQQIKRDQELMIAENVQTKTERLLEEHEREQQVNNVDDRERKRQHTKQRLQEITSKFEIGVLAEESISEMQDGMAEPSRDELGDFVEDGKCVAGTDWIQYLDDEGAVYFYNSATQETAWTLPDSDEGNYDNTTEEEPVQPVQPLQTNPDKQMDFEDVLLALSDFSVGVCLGRGSFGDVYHVRISGGGYYALKSIRKDRLSDPVDQQHCLDERHILLCAFHPNIVHLHGSFMDAANLYLVMEYVPGGELSTIVKERKGTLRVPTARFVMAQLMLVVVGYLHWPLSVAHRNIRPENILVSKVNITATLDAEETISDAVDCVMQ